MFPPLRPLLVLLFVAYAAFAFSPLLAAPPDQSADIILHARPGYEGAFRVGAWLPVVVELENAGPDREVEVRVGTREGAQYVVALSLPHNSHKTVMVYTHMTSNARRLLVRLFADGQEVTSEQLELVAANQRTRMVGLVSGPGAALRAPTRLPDGTSLLGLYLDPPDLPDHALGLSGFDALVFEDVATAELTPEQLEALHGWVLRGGHLLLSGGNELPTMLANLPPALQPVSVSEVERWPSVALLGSEARTGDLPLAQLQPRSDAVGRSAYPLPLANLAATAPLALEQHVGQGRVTALSMPLAHPALLGWENSPQLWFDLLRPATTLPPGFAPDHMSSNSFIENNLAATLTSLPALEFPPLGLLLGLVATYIILVGPGTYFVLRRLDRQDLGWIVVPALTLLFAIITYAWGYQQRGGDLLFNQVVLIQPSEEGVAQVRSFIGIFSPVQRAYHIQVSDQHNTNTRPLLRPVSIHGPWELGGSNASGFYMQKASATAQVREFSVAQWAMRALASDSSMPFGPLEATVERQGEQLVGRMHNSSALMLYDVTFIQGEQVARLGDATPGATLSGTLLPPQVEARRFFGPHIPLGYLLYGQDLDSENPYMGMTMQPDIQQRMRIVESLFSYGPSVRGGQPIMLAWADFSPLQVNADMARSSSKQLALITLNPQLDLGPNPIQLEPGWLQARFESSVENSCFGTSPGVSLSNRPASIQLQLPRDLYGLQVQELSLITSTDGPWQPSTLVELYDWQAATWDAQDTTQRESRIANPQRYLGSHGMLRVRVSGEVAPGNFHCVYVDAKLVGEKLLP
ncbi:hypothetical protein [Candidatus Viridilinea mediisalina]|uniref:DUF4350 domain-containing protein n=1 Tax=Candidatus Viridilinea mediisalina TaxID=2024553 RepID=A0A2A6RFI3_9CHLR|nr:hypothetical protein [Candidatus Viridilinea mediisalina]PDW01639.1 hypothetical protein CJ255_18055 [Candidatus Viridilinea mediisalina]